jgi:large subunit ribosomal protein L7Ae
MPKKVAKKTVVTTGGSKKTAGAKDSLFQKSPKNFRIGGDIQPKKDLTRFVRWPKYIRFQRQKRILLQRLKSPPAIAQFSNTVDANIASNLFKILKKYSPETTKEKKDRLKAEAEKRKDGKTEHVGPKPNHLKFGLNHVTTLVEEGKAKLVVIAHDVDPIEMMSFLPALCRAKGIPYCFFKGKAKLGQLVHTKNATCVALTEFNSEDLKELTQLATQFQGLYNDNVSHRRTWGGGINGIKHNHMMAAREKLREIELAKKANM